MPWHEVSAALGSCSPPALAVRSVAAEHPEVELKVFHSMALHYYSISLFPPQIEKLKM